MSHHHRRRSSSIDSTASMDSTHSSPSKVDEQDGEMGVHLLRIKMEDIKHETLCSLAGLTRDELSEIKRIPVVHPPPTVWKLIMCCSIFLNCPRDPWVKLRNHVLGSRKSHKCKPHSSKAGRPRQHSVDHEVVVGWEHYDRPAKAIVTSPTFIRDMVLMTKERIPIDDAGTVLLCQFLCDQDLSLEHVFNCAHWAVVLFEYVFSTLCIQMDNFKCVTAYDLDEFFALRGVHISRRQKAQSRVAKVRHYSSLTSPTSGQLLTPALDDATRAWLDEERIQYAHKIHKLRRRASLSILMQETVSSPVPDSGNTGTLANSRIARSTSFDSTVTTSTTRSQDELKDHEQDFVDLVLKANKQPQPFHLVRSATAGPRLLTVELEKPDSSSKPSRTGKATRSSTKIKTRTKTRTKTKSKTTTKPQNTAQLSSTSNEGKLDPSVSLDDAARRGSHEESGIDAISSNPLLGLKTKRYSKEDMPQVKEDDRELNPAVLSLFSRRSIRRSQAGGAKGIQRKKPASSNRGHRRRATVASAAPSSRAGAAKSTRDSRKSRHDTKKPLLVDRASLLFGISAAGEEEEEGKSGSHKNNNKAKYNHVKARVITRRKSAAVTKKK